MHSVLYDIHAICNINYIENSYFVGIFKYKVFQKKEPNIIHNMHFYIYLSLYTFHGMHFTICTSQYAFQSLYFTVCILQYAFYSMHFTVCILKYAFHSMHFTLFVAAHLVVLLKAPVFVGHPRFGLTSSSCL